MTVLKRILKVLTSADKMHRLRTRSKKNQGSNWLIHVQLENGSKLMCARAVYFK